MYPHVFEKDEIEYPACHPEGDIKLRGRSWLWVGSGTEKRLPVFKVKITVDDVDGDKEPMFSGKPGSGGLPQFAQVVAYGMKRKCDQVQSHQCVGQPLFAVSEVMLHVITVSFQQVKPFVFNLPARPTGCHNLGCIGFGDIKRGDEAKALRWLAVADSTNLKFNVIYLQRIVAISDRQLPCNTILINQIRLFASWCFFDHPLGWPCNTIEITEKCFMRTFFDAEDEIVTGLCNLFAHRVIGIQVIAQVNRTQGCVARCVLIEPAVGGFGFAVLFLIAVLRGDKLRSQRQHLAVSDADQCGAQHDMVIFGLARASKSGAALRTLNLVRVVEFRPIQCHKAAPVENLERLKCLIFLHLFQRYVESGVNILTIDAVQLFSNMIVSWQFADAE